MLVDRKGRRQSGFPGFLLCTTQAKVRVCLYLYRPTVTRNTCFCSFTSLLSPAVLRPCTCVSRLLRPKPIARYGHRHRSLSPHRRAVSDWHLSPHASRLTPLRNTSTPTTTSHITELITRLTSGRTLSLAPAAFHMKRGSNNNHLDGSHNSSRALMTAHA